MRIPSSGTCAQCGKSFVILLYDGPLPSGSSRLQGRVGGGRDRCRSKGSVIESRFLVETPLFRPIFIEPARVRVKGTSFRGRPCARRDGDPSTRTHATPTCV